jgi:hypothetical protein
MADPSWLSDSNDTPPPPPPTNSTPGWSETSQNEGASTSSSAASNAPAGSDEAWNAEVPKEAYYAKFCMNIGMGLFVSFTGVEAISFSTDDTRFKDTLIDAGVSSDVLCKAGTSQCATAAQDIGNIFVGFYMVFFGCILIFHELIQHCKIQFLDRFMKKNFGFLYGVHGKSSYMVFIGIMPSGLQSISLSTPCAITVAIWGALHTLWCFYRPNHFEKVKKYNPKIDNY